MRKITTLLLLTVVGLVLAMACGGEGTRPSRLAFHYDAYGNRSIYTSNPARSNPTSLPPRLPPARPNLTPLPAGLPWDGFPAWSPDGGRIAFYSANDLQRDIYVARADGSGLANLTDDPAEDALPAWSPDGARIAFYSDRDGNGA